MAKIYETHSYLKARFTGNEPGFTVESTEVLSDSNLFISRKGSMEWFLILSDFSQHGFEKVWFIGDDSIHTKTDQT